LITLIRYIKKKLENYDTGKNLFCKITYYEIKAENFYKLIKKEG